jgi:amino acid transporter
MAQTIGNQLLGGNGIAFATIIAATVVIALVGTSLSCLNTGVRVTYAMGKDTELPVVFGFLHGRFRTPHVGVIVLTIISAVIGVYGVLNIDNLTQVILVSNIGTFLLYGMTCVIGLIAFAGIKGRSVFSTMIAPVLGVTLNVLMLIGVLYFAIAGGGSTQTDSIIAVGFAFLWLVIGFGFLYGRKIFRGIPVLHPEDYKVKSGISASSTDAMTDEVIAAEAD